MGRYFIDALVASGAAVACFARPSPELDAVGQKHGDSVLALECDVGSHERVDSAVAGTVKHFGRLDFLVNNAAIFHPFRLEDATPTQVRDHVDINLLGPMWCMRSAIPHLRATKGHILSVSSESTRMPFPYLGVYAATKGGLEVLSAAMRDELREDGIRVTLLRSGSVSGSAGGRDWDPAVTTRFFETITRTGHAAFTGAMATPASMAKALVAILALPSDVNVDLIEVRATGSATVT